MAKVDLGTDKATEIQIKRSQIIGDGDGEWRWVKDFGQSDAYVFPHRSTEFGGIWGHWLNGIDMFGFRYLGHWNSRCQACWRSRLPWITNGSDYVKNWWIHRCHGSHGFATGWYLENVVSHFHFHYCSIWWKTGHSYVFNVFTIQVHHEFTKKHQENICWGRGQDDDWLGRFQGQSWVAPQCCRSNMAIVYSV